MVRSAVYVILISSFVIAVTQLIFGTFGPPIPPDYFLGGSVTALAGPEPLAKRLYLRRTIYLARHPDHAWMQVLATDELSIYINGTLLGTQRAEGDAVGSLLDVTQHLHPGANTFALCARQHVADMPPMIAFEAAYRLGDAEHSLGVDCGWRCSSVLEHRAAYWFSPEFDDHHWLTPQRQQRYMLVETTVPPLAIKRPLAAKWITTPGPQSECLALRRRFSLSAKPTAAWLTMATGACYRLAINGVAVSSRVESLATNQTPHLAKWTSEITPFLQRGDNTLSILLIRDHGIAWLAADIEITTGSGEPLFIATDGQWQGLKGVPKDWYQPRVDNSSDWGPCDVAHGGLPIVPWKLAHSVERLEMPADESAYRWCEWFAIALVVASITVVSMRCVERRLRAASAAWQQRRSLPIAALPLVPVALATHIAIAIAAASTQISRQAIYRPCWVIVSIAAVVMTWLWMVHAARRTPRIWRCPHTWLNSRLCTAAALAGLMIAAVGLRAGRLTDPIQNDEVTQSLAVEGLWQRGFPSLIVRDDQPPSLISTSELVYFVVGLCSTIFPADLAHNRYPAFLWGLATIPLLYYCGRQWFSREVGLIAASWETFSPSAGFMSTWGRYPAQLQFITLLCVYSFWRTIQGSSIQRTALWCTTACFIAMYLTWEGSACVAIGMICAVLLHRRADLRNVLGNRHVWLAILTVLLAIVLQYSHRSFQQIHRLWYGYGDTALELAPVWRYPHFALLSFVRQALWDNHLASAMAILGGGVVLAASRHRYSGTMRFVLAVVCGTCFFMAALLSINAIRYSYHMSSLMMLIAAGVLVAALQLVMQGARCPADRFEWYLRSVATAAAAGVVVSAWGLTLRAAPDSSTQRELPTYSAALRFFNFAGPMDYLSARWRAGDVLVTDLPLLVEGEIGRLPGGQNNFPAVRWLQSTHVIQAVLDDREPRLFHRLNGVQMIGSLDELKELFARHERIWCLCSSVFAQSNGKQVTQYLLSHMEVAHEDFAATLLVRDNNHRTAAQTGREAVNRQQAFAHILPPGT